jgi:ABC-2 type transport system permease protein
LILAVIEKELRMFFRYPLRVISSILVGIVFLLQFVYFGQAVLGGRYSPLLEASTGLGDYPTYALIGYTLWWVSSSPIEAYVWGVRRELQRGTFEANVLSPSGLARILLGLATSWLLMDSFLMLLVFLFGVFLFKIPLTSSIILKSVPVIVLSLTAFLGFGFLFAGLVMLLKNIGPLAQIFEFGMLFLAGVFFPLEVLPPWVREIADFIPLTHSTAIVRAIFSGRSYGDVIGPLFRLSLLIPAYWLVGYLLFRWAEKTTRVVGYGGY